MTTRFVIPAIAALACTIFIAACDSKSAPSKACVEAARLYAEALDVDRTVPGDEKAEKITLKKEALEVLEERKIKECGE
ncbi:MAG: hypothetical protein ABI604_15785 [Nitrospirota bacterium]